MSGRRRSTRPLAPEPSSPSSPAVVTPDALFDDIEKDDDESSESAPASRSGSTRPMTASASESGGRVVDVGESSRSLPVRAADLGRVGALERFLDQVGRFPLLSAEEEQELATRAYTQGDALAARKLVVHNLRLVVKMAYRYRRAWASVLDLIQEGNVGLIEAVKRFDPLRGARFSTYAAYWIRAYMISYLLEHSRMVRISRTRVGRKLFFRLSRERERLRSMGIEPGPKLLAEKLGVSEEALVEVARHMDQPEIRLDAPLAHDGDGTETVLDTMSATTLSPEALAVRSEFNADVGHALDGFGATLSDPREKAAWNEHLMAEDPVSLSELGERFGVTKQRMGQIVNALRKRLKDHLVKVLGPDVELNYSSEGE